MKEHQPRWVVPENFDRTPNLAASFRKLDEIIDHETLVHIVEKCYTRVNGQWGKNNKAVGDRFFSPPCGALVKEKLGLEDEGQG